ncbi:FtsX-like permease family protein [bacterium]|nr:FtsX-like permease family protein [bacterium]
MKYLGYIFRNVRRNILRTILTIGSIGISLFLMMLMLSFLSINATVSETLKGSNRLISMSSQGFAVPLPIRFVEECKAIPGVEHASPLAWFGGSFKEEKMPFAQFGVDADTFSEILYDRKVPAEQLKAFQDDPAGCVIGYKMAAERGLKIGDPLPLKGAIYPIDLDLTVRAIYECKPTEDGRALYYHWKLMEELLKSKNQGRMAGNAGVVYLRLADDANEAEICRKIDAMSLNSQNPTRTMTEDAFVSQFAEMWGDMRTMITAVGFAVVVSLIFVSGNAMAMALRERTTEIAVLKAIGFTNGRILGMVLSECVIVAAIGGLVGALGCKLLFDVVDVSTYTAGGLPFFFVPWRTAMFGLGVSLVIGFVSGLFPAISAARLGVIQGLRKVV